MASVAWPGKKGWSEGRGQEEVCGGVGIYGDVGVGVRGGMRVNKKTVML